MPRKTGVMQPQADWCDRASMRPRPDAAENGRAAGDDAVQDRVASMRPRPDAAENMNDSFEIEAGAIELQ